MFDLFYTIAIGWKNPWMSGRKENKGKGGVEMKGKTEKGKRWIERERDRPASSGSVSEC